MPDRTHAPVTLDIHQILVDPAAPLPLVMVDRVNGDHRQQVHPRAQVRRLQRALVPGALPARPIMPGVLILECAHAARRDHFAYASDPFDKSSEPHVLPRHRQGEVPPLPVTPGRPARSLRRGVRTPLERLEAARRGERRTGRSAPRASARVHRRSRALIEEGDLVMRPVHRRRSPVSSRSAPRSPSRSQAAAPRPFALPAPETGGGLDRLGGARAVAESHGRGALHAQGRAARW